MKIYHFKVIILTFLYQLILFIIPQEKKLMMQLKNIQGFKKKWLGNYRDPSPKHDAVINSKKKRIIYGYGNGKVSR